MLQKNRTNFTEKTVILCYPKEIQKAYNENK